MEELFFWNGNQEQKKKLQNAILPGKSVAALQMGISLL